MPPWNPASRMLPTHPSLVAYGLQPPIEARARATLRTQLGAAAADRVWRECCVAAGVVVDVTDAARPDAPPLSLDALERVAAALLAAGGAARLAGRSLSIRLRTYRLLVARCATLHPHGTVAVR